MTKVSSTRDTKRNLHPRNPHNAPYDLAKLTTLVPALKPFLKTSPKGELTLDFTHPSAVKALNQALLLDVYQIDFWDIPEGALCPAVPGRADYIHYLADLLAEDNQGEVPKGGQIRRLDIGVGANCIYPIIGAQSYGWSWVGSDINPISIKMAEQIVQFNAPIKKKIRCRLQKDHQQILKGIVGADEYFHFTLCNPPFHASEAEATKGTQRKINNLKRGTQSTKAQNPVLNFAGQHAELWCEGGEVSFVKRIVAESALFKEQCLWFTCLVSKKANLPAIKQAIKQVKASEYKVVEMAQGQKQSRFIAWTFIPQPAREQWFDL